MRVELCIHAAAVYLPAVSYVRLLRTTRPTAIGVERRLRVDEYFFAPDVIHAFFAAYKRACPFDQKEQQFHWCSIQLHRLAVAFQLKILTCGLPVRISTLTTLASALLV
jgi:hypothetical protein